MEEKISCDSVEICTIKSDSKQVEYKSKEFIENALRQLN